MDHEELRALHDKRVHGDWIVSGTAHGIVWEVRQRVNVAQWPDRTVTPLDGQYRVSLVLPWTDNLRRDFRVYDFGNVLNVAGRSVDSEGDAGEHHRTEHVVGEFIEAPSLAEAIANVTAWALACVERGYLPP